MTIPVRAASAALFMIGPALGAPALYGSRDLQSPVRGDGGDLLQLSGADLDPAGPVYIRALDPEQAPLPVPVVREVSDSQALILRLPDEVRADQRYVIGLGSPAEPGPRITINEARPGWFLPNRLPVRGVSAGLTRDIKIVGRNLAAVTRVRLEGPRNLMLAAMPARESAGLDEFVIRAAIPEDLPAGEYRVAVTTDDKIWSALEMPLRIAAERLPARLEVSAPSFGGCRPDDGRDDTACILAALAAAARAGNTALHFPAGEWLLDATGPGVDRWDGIRVPSGVSLVGEAGQTTLRRGPHWRSLRDTPMFTLVGPNLVKDLSFTMNPVQDPGDGAFLQIGRLWQFVDAGAVTAAEGITLTGNTFHGAALGVRSGGLPARQLVITHNRFQARRLGLAMGGDSRNTRTTFRIEDAIVSHNLFEPGSYLDASIGQGAFAAEFGAGERVDFSDNRADGLSTAALDAPGDARGWRAAFFWHLLGPQERLLISANEVSCSGDKAGDGEAISLDNNHNSFAFVASRTVLAAAADRVIVAGPLSTEQGGASGVDPGTYYPGHWLQIAAGRGIGQSRRVVAATYDAVLGRSTMVVSPEWDVIPAAGDSRVMVGRAFWQTLIVGNRSDHRSPPCAKSNRTARRGGSISIWAQSSDSVVAFNRLLDTNGIAVQQLYGRGGSLFQYFLEVRGNEIDGDYDSRSPDGHGSFFLSHGAGPDDEPAVAGFGVVIAHNRVTRPSAAPGPAIAAVPTWYRGPAPYRWPLIDRLLVYGNSLAGGGSGIDIPRDALLRGAVFSANECHTATRASRPAKSQGVWLCAQRRPGYCECDEN